MLIGVNSLTKSFGNHLLFQNISFNIEQNDRIGLIGANGCGKTTLFNIMLGKEDYDSGDIVRRSNIKIGVLQQHACHNSRLDCYSEALSVFDALSKLEGEIESINNKLESNPDAQLLIKQSELQEKFLREGGLTYKARTRSALVGLGFAENELCLPISALSGGQRSKLELCKLLLAKSDLMLLDEPTNHLDIKSIMWLEDFLRSSKNAFIVISHDRYFLDSVINRVFELENNKLMITDGNYTKFKEIKKLRQQTITSNYENVMHEVKRVEGIIEQQRRWNREKNIKTAESKQKMIDRMMENLEVPDVKKQNMRLVFSEKFQSGNDCLICDNISAGFEGKKLFSNLSFEMHRGEKAVIIGPNGCGKTTLLKKILNKEKGIRIGTNVSIGYFDQQQQDLPEDKTIFEYLRDEFPEINDTEIRSALAAFMFAKEDVFSLLGKLSGGERARVSLCRLMLAHNNFLLLDEPTNHLDLESREILEDSLKNFGGTVLAVSHDRYFINSIADRILSFNGEDVLFLSGNFFDENRITDKADSDKQEEKTVSTGREQYLKKKQEMSELRKLRSAIANCESKINGFEKRKKELEHELEDPDIFADYEKTIVLTEELSSINAKIEEEITRWEKLSGEAESF